MASIKATKDNFKEEVLESKLPVLVEFWATWCGPCQEMAPVLEEMAGEGEGKFKVAKVNIDEELAITSAYSVLAVPSVMVLKNGEITSASAGAKGKEELLKMLEE